MDLHRCGKVMERRRNVDYLAGRLLQFLEGCPADVERAFCIDIDDRSEAVRRQFVSGAEKIAGGSVDDNVDPSVMFDCTGDRVLHFGKIAYVTGHSKTLAAVVVDKLLHRREVVDLSARNRKLRSVLGKSPRDTARNTRTAAGYKRNFTL